MRRTLAYLLFVIFMNSPFLQAAELPSLQRVKPTPANPANKVYDDHTLTRQQILDCLHREQALLQRANIMKHEEHELSRQADRVQQMGKKLKVLETHLNSADAVAMDDFRFRVDIYRRAEQQYNSHATDFNQRLTALKTNQQQYNQQCADKQYYEDDYKQAMLSFKFGTFVAAHKTSASVPARRSAGFYLQLGAFRQKQSVDALYHRLTDETFSLEQQRNPHGLIIVRAGPFGDKDEAERIRHHLEEHYNIKSFVQNP